MSVTHARGIFPPSWVRSRVLDNRLPMTRLLDHHIEYSPQVPHASGDFAARIDVAEVPDHRIVSGGDQCRHVKVSFCTWPNQPSCRRPLPIYWRLRPRQAHIRTR